MSTLTALLLPALSASKERSRRTICRNNIRQFAIACHLYGYDNGDYFPSGLDNFGQVRSMLVSDNTYASLTTYANNDAVLDCPNIHIDSVARTNTNLHGFRIGYNYLAGVAKPRDANSDLLPLKLTATATNYLVTDVNYRTETSGGMQIKIAAHTDKGPIYIDANNTTMSMAALMRLGSDGGNVGFLDTSVIWKPIRSMRTHQVTLDYSTGSVTCTASW